MSQISMQDELKTQSKSQSKLAKAFDEKTLARRVKHRDRVDLGWKGLVSVGGVSIIFAVLLIMFFLIYVVLPLFVPAKVELKSEFSVPGNVASPTLFYDLDEYKETAIRVDESGEVSGFSLHTGEILSQTHLELSGKKIVSQTQVVDNEKLMAFGLSGGGVLLVKFEYQISYPNDQRQIDVEVSYPFGEDVIEMSGGNIDHLAVRISDSEVMIVTKTNGENKIRLRKFDKAESLFGDAISLEKASEASIPYSNEMAELMLDVSMRNLYLVRSSGVTHYYDITDLEDIKLRQTVSLTNIVDKENISSIRFLLGGFSLMVGTDQGRVLQWFPVRGDDNLFRLQQIRSFELDDNQQITEINIEHMRKGFATLDSQQQLNIFHSTAERHLSSVDLDAAGLMLQITPRADGILVEKDNGKVAFYDVENEHPDVSMSSLWGEVWYEGYSEPSYVWQSSSASSDYEPKFSMMPLTFGTIKAALYSMLFAVPIAVLAALYTAFFMDKKSRDVIKPTIELIEALPTVILGFLAGLWLAPYMEAHLSGFFALFFVVPIGILMVGFGYSKLPESIRVLMPVGKRALLMIPVVGFLGWLALALDNTLQDLFFSGDMRHWLTVSAGIDFDQRNALVIGFAMGFALIPTIFSVAEDAIYNVPSFLVNGSLALGASGWQTIVGVVLPTASPGIFSAIMLGFGRGVGETMIVLMASGNTPLMDANIFEGLRTLSANLAVEMAETELYSTHYRVLFLSGLLLFVFTFIFNTLAEIVRERMRKKYGSL